MTPERLDEIRALVAGHNPVMGLRHIATDLLAALDAERAAHDETRRERDEALTDATRWRDEQAEIDADLSDADDWIAENAKIRALPEAERTAAVEDARARGVFDGEGREPADYTDLMRTAATMPSFVRTCMKLREASERAEKAERERDVLLADWREIDALPAVHAAFVEGMKLSDAVAAALADVHYAEGTPLFDAEIAKREAEAERDEARAALMELVERAAAFVAACHAHDEAMYHADESAKTARMGFALDAADHYAALASCAMDAAIAAENALGAALASSTASLAGQQRARVLREAADAWVAQHGVGLLPEWLRARADEAER